MDGVDKVLCQWPFQVSEALRERLDCFLCPFLDVIFDKGVDELIPPFHMFDVQSTILKRPQRWELPELREGWKAIKLGMIELSVESLDFAPAPLAGTFSLYVFSVGVDSSQIFFYVWMKDLELYKSN